MNRSERRELQARLRADEAALDARIEELWATDLDGMEGTQRHEATMARLAAEGWTSEQISDLSELRYELDNYKSYGERVAHVLMTYVLMGWLVLFAVGGILAATGVIAHSKTLPEVWFLGSVAIVAVALLTSWIGDRQGW